SPSGPKYCRLSPLSPRLAGEPDRPPARAGDRGGLQPNGTRLRHSGRRRSPRISSPGEMRRAGNETPPVTPCASTPRPALASARAPRAASQPPRRRAALRSRAVSLDHLVSQRQQLVWDFEAERLRGSEIDQEGKFRGLLYRQVGRLLAFENAASI